MRSKPLPPPTDNRGDSLMRFSFYPVCSTPITPVNENLCPLKFTHKKMRHVFYVSNTKNMPHLGVLKICLEDNLNNGSGLFQQSFPGGQDIYFASAIFVELLTSLGNLFGSGAAFESQ